MSKDEAIYSALVETNNAWEAYCAAQARYEELLAQKLAENK